MIVSDITLVLYAANGSQVKYGQKILTLDFGIRRPIMADVSHPIIRADLLKHYGFIMDIQGKRLIDKVTQLNVPGFKRQITYASIKTIDSTSTYHHILADYSRITKKPQLPANRAHGIFHHIQTKGLPVASRSRRLPPDKLRIAKAEFANLVQLSICRPSNSP
ncbi:hypothetical protein ALC56_09022 [Trachymyrmex septentrionalis]|uniref:Uncharacterized protein n=1 Tax=Trachymyrmex septentrionalis TaxID=34720 RepID=A0A151JUZ0_9HYME|nr:hypothetical protein ALC56_09022 [Trachymyrmex septentrionalis]